MLPQGACWYSPIITPFYIGQKKGSKEVSRYFGSGTRLISWYASKGLPVSPFQRPLEMSRLGVSRKILIWAKDCNELNRLEEFFVNSVLNTPGCLNMVEGGDCHDTANKGMICWTDGVNNIYSDCSPGHSYWEGMTKKATTGGKKWFTNGETRLLAGECPDGFQPGMGKTELTDAGRNCISKSTKRLIGLHHWTDGKTNKVAKNCPGDGFYQGLVCLSEEARANRMKGLRAGWERDHKKMYKKSDHQLDILFPI
jgi:hypothetical protein